MTRLRVPISQCVREDAGFTLIELLVSLALLALILLALPAALRLSGRTSEISSDLDRVTATRIAMAFIEQRLSQAMPLYRRGDDGRLQIFFRGQPDSVSFVSASPVGPSGGGLYRFELKAKAAENDEPAIVLGWSLYQAIPDDANSPPPAGERMLIADIDGLSFRYFGRHKENAQPEWGDDWTRNDMLPDLVEVRAVSRTSGASFIRVVELKLRAGS